MGLRQSRYFGRVKTRRQLYLAATVANLTLVAAKAGLTGKTGSGPSASSAQVAGMVNSAANAATAWLGQIPDPHPARIGLTDQIPLPNEGFPSGFLGDTYQNLKVTASEDLAVVETSLRGVMI